jgi:Flp pilus assembly protein TadD
MAKKKEAMYKKAEEDFRQDLAEQIHLLKKAAEGYDNGDLSETKNMGLRLRVLLHDTKGPTTSVLTHLNVKDNMTFYDTAQDCSEDNLLFETGLIITKVETNPSEPTRLTFEAPLGNVPPKVIFPPNGGEPTFSNEVPKIHVDDWMNKPVIDNKNGTICTRWGLIDNVCHKDGGAHIDAELRESYEKLLHSNPMIPVGPHGGIIISNIVYPSIRQIAYEVLKSLKDEFPEYIGDDDLDFPISGESVPGLNQKGWKLFEQGKNAKAKEFFLKSLKLKYNNPIAHNNLGVIYENEGDSQKATEKYIIAVKQSPNYPEANNNLGNMLLLERNCKDAIKHFNKALKIASNYHTAYFNLGNTYYKCKYPYNFAIRAYKKVIKINPDYAEAYCNLGVMYFDLGHFNLSEECYKTSLELKKDYTEAHYNLGNLYTIKSQNENAIKSYKNFIKYAGHNFPDAVIRAKEYIESH